MRRKLFGMAFLGAALASFSLLAGTQDVTIVEGDLSDVLVEHVAYSPLTINATYSGINVSAGGTLVVRDTSGNIIVSTNATAVSSSVLQAVTVAGNWATNLTEITRYYGDMRVNGYGNPLPWLAIDVRPGYNTGDEQYVPPRVGEWLTNGVSIGTSDTISKVNLSTGLVGTVSGETLRIEAEGAPDPNAIYKDGSRVYTGNQDMGSNELYNASFIRSYAMQLLGGLGTQGTMTWNTEEETVDLICDGSTLQIGQEFHVHVKNGWTSTITNGTLVGIIGSDGASGNLKVAPYLADGSVLPGFMVGVATETIPVGGVGKVTSQGKVRNLDTSGYNQSAVLYASWLTAGGFETNAPAQGVGQWLPVAAVINSHPTVGTIYVRITAIDLHQWPQYAEFAAHTNLTLAGGAHGGEADPLSVLADGSRGMTGTLDMQSNNVTHVFNVYGRDDSGLRLRADDAGGYVVFLQDGAATIGKGGAVQFQMRDSDNTFELVNGKLMLENGTSVDTILTTGLDTATDDDLATAKLIYDYGEANWANDTWRTNQISYTTASITIDGTAANVKITPTNSTTIALGGSYPHGRDIVYTYYGTNSITWPVEYTLLSSAQGLTLTGTNIFATMYQGGTNYNLIGVAE